MLTEWKGRSVKHIQIKKIKNKKDEREDREQKDLEDIFKLKKELRFGKQDEKEDL